MKYFLLACLLASPLSAQSNLECTLQGTFVEIAIQGYNEQVDASVVIENLSGLGADRNQVISIVGLIYTEVRPTPAEAPTIVSNIVTFCENNDPQEY